MLRLVKELVGGIVVAGVVFVADKVTKIYAPEMNRGIKDGIKDAGRTAIALFPGSEAENARRKKLSEQAQEYTARCKAAYRQRRSMCKDKDWLLETTFLAGNSLAAYVREGKVPEEIQKAYELQYPELAEHHSLLEELHRLDPSQISGLVSGIKGKLFEMRYLDFLNAGHLPHGYHATLAEAANQPGWDITVTGPNQHIAELIQLKATDSVGYVQHALQTYPHIDVVTTSEVYSHLAMLGSHVADSGISDTALTAEVTHGFDAANVHMHFGPPILALAIAAWSSYKRADLDLYERYKRFGARGTKSWLAYIAGGTVAVVTQTWWLAIIGSIGARMMLEKGQARHSELENLDAQIEKNQQVLAKLSLA